MNPNEHPNDDSVDATRNRIGLDINITAADQYSEESVGRELVTWYQEADQISKAALQDGGDFSKGELANCKCRILCTILRSLGERHLQVSMHHTERSMVLNAIEQAVIPIEADWQGDEPKGYSVHAADVLTIITFLKGLSS